MTGKSITPGPWVYKQEVDRRFDSMTGEPKEEVQHWVGTQKAPYLILFSRHAHGENIEANAKAAAALPDVIEALQMFVTYKASIAAKEFDANSLGILNLFEIAEKALKKAGVK